MLLIFKKWLFLNIYFLHTLNTLLFVCAHVCVSLLQATEKNVF